MSICACGGSPSAPALAPSATFISKVIALSGNLAFGKTQVGKSVTGALTITNNGSGPLTVSGITMPMGYSTNWTSGAIAAGRLQVVAVTFAPVAVQSYDGTLMIVADQTSGAVTMPLSGAGIATGGNVARLISPVNGAVLANSAPGNRPVWTFTWTAVPGASTYRLYVKQGTASFPAVDVSGIAKTTYDYQTIGDVTTSNLPDWRWMVQSDDGWSETGIFSVAPPAPALPLASRRF
jgi:hypothetical protein